jgi:hypothetical protein
MSASVVQQPVPTLFPLNCAADLHPLSSSSMK